MWYGQIWPNTVQNVSVVVHDHWKQDVKSQSIKTTDAGCTLAWGPRPLQGLDCDHLLLTKNQYSCFRGGHSRALYFSAWWEVCVSVCVESDFIQFLLSREPALRVAQNYVLFSAATAFWSNCTTVNLCYFSLSVHFSYKHAPWGIETQLRGNIILISLRFKLLSHVYFI